MKAELFSFFKKPENNYLDFEFYSALPPAHYLYKQGWEEEEKKKKDLLKTAIQTCKKDCFLTHAYQGSKVYSTQKKFVSDKVVWVWDLLWNQCREISGCTKAGHW